MKTYKGGCHCGRVQFEVKADIQEAIACNCSICEKKGFLHYFADPKDFKLISGEENLLDYQFNTKTAHHYFCKTCGIHSYYIPRSHPDKIDVNVRCLEGLNWRDLPYRVFDGQNWEEAIKKLKK